MTQFSDVYDFSALPDGILTEEQAEQLLSSFCGEPFSDKRYTVRDILREHFPAYLETHHVHFYQEKAVRAIMACGTGELGYTLTKCSECGIIRIHADTCGNRNCPSCGYLKQLKWRACRESELIGGIYYFHVIFTLPHSLNDLIGCNKKEMLNLLFQAASQSVLNLSQDTYGMVPGIQMVLHTCGGNMLPHYHIHMFVSGGGLSKDRKSFVQTTYSGFFLPVAQLSAFYRSLFLSGLKKLYENDGLSFYGNVEKYKNHYEWKELLESCYSQDWDIEIRKYLAQGPSKGEDDYAWPSNISGHFAGYASRKIISPGKLEVVSQPAASPHTPQDTDAAVVLEYMSQYMNRTAITDNRIIGYNTRFVVFECKQYSDGVPKIITLKLTVEEFIRRFLENILPPGFMKIRSAGFLAGSVRAKYLALIRHLLEIKAPENPVKDMGATELVMHFYGIDFSACPRCNAHMLCLGRRLGKKSAAIRLSYMTRAS